MTDARLHRFGLTQERWAAILDVQGGVCAGCLQTEPLAVDHDHACCNEKESTSCGSCVRGGLCRRCNTALGMLNDDPETVRRLLAYLERPPADEVPRAAAEPATDSVATFVPMSPGLSRRRYVLFAYGPRAHVCRRITKIAGAEALCGKTGGEVANYRAVADLQMCARCWRRLRREQG